MAEFVYTVFREDYDENTEGRNGMWNRSFTKLERAMQAVEGEVRDMWDDIPEHPAPKSFSWQIACGRSNCWILDSDETGTLHTILQTEVESADPLAHFGKEVLKLINGEYESPENTVALEYIIDEAVCKGLINVNEDTGTLKLK